MGHVRPPLRGSHNWLVAISPGAYAPGYSRPHLRCSGRLGYHGRTSGAPENAAVSEEQMSDHVWSQDHIEAFVVGGLTAEEADRLERHVRECAECAADLATARRLDRGLGGLFAEVRTAPGLEDRAVRSTRAAERRAVRIAGS